MLNRINTNDAQTHYTESTGHQRQRETLKSSREKGRCLPREPEAAFPAVTMEVSEWLQGAGKICHPRSLYSGKIAHGNFGWFPKKSVTI